MQQIQTISHVLFFFFFTLQSPGVLFITILVNIYLIKKKHIKKYIIIILK